MIDLRYSPSGRRISPTGLALLALALVGLVSLPQLLLPQDDHGVVHFVTAPWCVHWVGLSFCLGTAGSKLIVLAAMLISIAVRTWLDSRTEPKPIWLNIALLAAATGMAGWHWFHLDRFPEIEMWQRTLYLQIVAHLADAPHNFRPLPHGFTRTLEWITGDWQFACLSYRWFFSYWFLWSCYRFSRLFHPPRKSLAVLGAVVVLYPFSIYYYWGQLTDPLSHTLFVLALIYTVEDRIAPLALTLALGVLAKETIVLMVPAYWVCHRQKGLAAFRNTALLAAVCAIAFLSVRLPLGWRPTAASMNGAGLMIWANLGLADSDYLTAAPWYQNYLQPLLFVGIFLPFIAPEWWRIDARLRALGLTLTPLLLASNLCFGWMYESRNYLPLVPLLATMALPVRSPVPGRQIGSAEITPESA